MNTVHAQNRDDNLVYSETVIADAVTAQRKMSANSIRCQCSISRWIGLLLKPQTRTCYEEPGIGQIDGDAVFVPSHGWEGITLSSTL